MSQLVQMLSHDTFTLRGLPVSKHKDERQQTQGLFSAHTQGSSASEIVRELLHYLHDWTSSWRTRCIQLLAVLCFVILCMSSAYAASNILKTTYFTVDLGTSWQTSGSVHNQKHSVNVNLSNKAAKSAVNVVVGAAKNHSPMQMLTDLQNDLMKQGARVEPIKQKGDIYYFTFSLQGNNGYSRATTNKKDVCVINVIGNTHAAFALLRKFTNVDAKLFPQI